MKYKDSKNAYEGRLRNSNGPECLVVVVYISARQGSAMTHAYSIESIDLSGSRLREGELVSAVPRAFPHKSRNRMIRKLGIKMLFYVIIRLGDSSLGPIVP